MGETWDIIFDGDMLVHEAALAAESSMCWEEDVWTTTADFTFAKAHLNKVIEDCVRRFSDRNFLNTWLLCRYGNELASGHHADVQSQSQRQEEASIQRPA